MAGGPGGYPPHGDRRGPVNRIQGSPGYVLHARPYRESSQLLELLTPGEGRIAAVLRGGRGRGRSTARPFVRLDLAWSGRGEVHTLNRCDEAAVLRLTGARAVCGLYVNELAIKLLPRQLPDPGFYAAYEAVLAGLADPAMPPEPGLRRYELALLRLLGEGLDFIDPAALEAQVTYVVPPQGLPRPAAPGEESPYAIGGDSLAALLQDRLEGRGQRREAQRLLRRLLEYHLEGKPIVSRQLIARGRLDRTS
nr:DNA repair protein RecO [Ectothiorhodospira mobilis]